MSDLYNSMTELVRTHNDSNDFMFSVDYRESSNLITAIHGGGIEAGTSELAQYTAEITNSNYFSFKGLKSSDNTELHVTSTHYDNPLLLTLNSQMNHTVSIHGYGDSEKNTYIGGSDKQLVTLISQYLTTAGFKNTIAPSNLGGVDIDNVTNKNKRGAGVQLELSTAQRKALFNNNDFSRANRESRINWSDDLRNYANAIAKALRYVN